MLIQITFLRNFRRANQFLCKFTVCPQQVGCGYFPSVRECSHIFYHWICSAPQKELYFDSIFVLFHWLHPKHWRRLALYSRWSVARYVKQCSWDIGALDSQFRSRNLWGASWGGKRSISFSPLCDDLACCCCGLFLTWPLIFYILSLRLWYFGERVHEKRSRKIFW